MDVLMPQLGETVAEGKIVRWFKSAGDAVARGDNLFEIETDKVSMEVPAIAEGTLTDIRFQVGEVANVGAVVATIAGEVAVAGAVALPSAPKAPPATFARIPEPDMQSRTEASRPLDPFFEVRTPARNFGPARTAGGAVATPLARRLAGENGIDLAAVSGSGPNGRIVADDVEKARGSAREKGETLADVRALYAGVDYEERPLDAMRAAMARRLVEAQRNVPQIHLVADLAMEALLRLRDEANAAAPKDGPGAYRLSVTDLVVKAWALALQRVPSANAVWAGDAILQFKRSDVGVAVDGGPIAPVIRDAESKPLSVLSREIEALAARARDGGLSAAELRGGASAVADLGMDGVRAFAAVLDPPRSTILALGAVERRPVEGADGAVRFESRMSVTLSCDSRVVDGACGAQLLAAFRTFVESPVQMLV